MQILKKCCFAAFLYQRFFFTYQHKNTSIFYIFENLRKTYINITQVIYSSVKCVLIPCVNMLMWRGLMGMEFCFVARALCVKWSTVLKISLQMKCQKSNNKSVYIIVVQIDFFIKFPPTFGHLCLFFRSCGCVWGRGCVSVCVCCSCRVSWAAVLQTKSSTLSFDICDVTSDKASQF